MKMSARLEGTRARPRNDRILTTIHSRTPRRETKCTSAGVLHVRAYCPASITGTIGGKLLITLLLCAAFSGGGVALKDHENPYDILGVARNASPKEIKKVPSRITCNCIVYVNFGNSRMSERLCLRCA